MWFYQHRKLFIGFAILAFLFVGFFGLAHLGMDPEADSAMTNCFFMKQMAICNMNALEHFAAWEGMFVFNELKIFFFVLFAFILFFFFFKQTGVNICRVSFDIKFLEINKHLVIPNVIKDAFSNGILNSKAF